MPAPTTQALSPVRLAELQRMFATLLPRIERHGRIYFRHLRSHRKAEVMQEMRGLAWLWFLRLAQRGKNINEFLTTFNTFLARSVGNGRRVMGYEKAKDAMSERTQRRRGFKVEPLPTEARLSYESLYSTVHGQREHDAFEERLADNTQTPVPDQVSFRIDFPQWLTTRTERDRRIIDDMVMGERTGHLARTHGISPARISQLRREYKADWQTFCGDRADEPERIAIDAA